ncbi:LptF/LptG family permease [Candidatus Pelagibacter bacterium]|nr:LptF/LptG family permease [Candidatus Pelagibacter bacterium]
MIKTYQKYLIKQFSSIVLQVSLIFFSLVFILNVFEEINFLKDSDVNFLYPLLLTFLNSPAVFFQIFPFIFLISTQFFFLKITDKKELPIYKNFGLSNFKILSTIVTFSFILGFFIVIVFYNFSAKLKFVYLDLKNSFSNDNKYLAVVTENGLWIKDEINDFINIVYAEKLIENSLINVSITQFNNDFKLIKTIKSDKVLIDDYFWKLENPIIAENQKPNKKINNLILETHFNLKKIKGLFSNLSSLDLVELDKLKKDYFQLGYSTTEISLHQQKLVSFPIYLTLMTLFASIIMLNIRQNKPKVFNLLLGIMLSVIVYYINFFSGTLAQNEKIPIILSVWLPLIVLLLLSTIGIIRINEK